MDNLIKISEQLQEFIRANWKSSFNEPTGILKYKFLDPAANYRGQLWDWDSYFCGLALIDVYDETAEYVKGCVLNFVDHIAPDGSIPYMMKVSPPNKLSYATPKHDINGRASDSDLNSIKPLLAQMTVLACSKLNDKEWVNEIYGALKMHIEHWETAQKCESGLFVWRSYRGSGTDNHPAIYGRPLNSCAGVELNCFMYREYLSMAEIAMMCNDEKSADKYKKSAEELAEAVNLHMWDEIDGLYYHLDVQSQKPKLALQDVTWDVPLKFRTWTCFLPMWAGIAPEDRAERMVKEHLINPNEFWSDYGLRTLAKNEKMYSVTEMSNPSNWQGPIWIVSTYLMFNGLIKYGYGEIATKVCENLLTNLIRDINECGMLHEYYNPETGKSTIGLGFMNWNGLAGLMVPEILNLKNIN